MKKMLFAICTAAVVMFVAGCATQSNAVSSQYVGSENASMTGSYSAILNCTMFEADKAIREAADEANFVENRRNNCQEYMSYVYQDMYETKISFRLEEKGEGQVKLIIRVGKLGNRKLSQELLQSIDEKLHAMID